jgi:ParB family transcriptional regulator, chromosome partitioning protein
MVTEEKVERVAIGKVKPAADNLREKIGDVAELAMSIREVGIENPIVAVKRNGHFEVVAGARRLAAAELAGEDTVPLIVRELTEEQRLLAMAIENLQREDLSPLEEARAYQRLLDTLKISQRDLAPRVGKTQSHISKRVSLLALPRDVQGQVDSGGITIPDALELAKLADHPEHLKRVLKRPGYTPLDHAINLELRKLETEQKIAKLEEEIESKGKRTIRVGSEFNLPKNVHRLKNFNSYDQQALQIMPAKHETFDCHAIAIGDNALAFPVCTDRSNHKDVKTKQEADRAERGTKRTATRGYQPPRETPKQKQLRELRAKRLEFVGTLLAKKPPSEALRFVLRLFVLQQIEYQIGEASLDRAAIWLGLVDAPGGENTTLPDDVDVPALLTEFALQGDAPLHRGALALAVGDIEHGYESVDGYLDDLPTSWGTGGAAIAYLAFLESQGYALSDRERKLRDATPEAKTSRRKR